MRLAMICLAAACLVALPGATPVRAQDQTLADIRQELSVLMVEIRELKRELSTTAGPTVAVGGDILQRADLIEGALRQLTARTEELEFRINRVVRDGTNQIGDLEFRVCELEQGCDPGSIGETAVLGGGPENPVTGVRTPRTQDTELAVGEQADFDRARSALEAGSFRRAADLFAAFTETYTGGPLTGSAHFYRGEALAGIGETSASARAYLASFSGDPNGPMAADALLRLGQSLGELGQTREACVTLAEVSARFSGASQTAEAEADRRALGCS